MLKRFFILLFVLAIVAGSVSAQARVGMKFGYNLGGVLADYTGHLELITHMAGNPENFHLRSGFNGGLIVDCPINNVIAIQPGVRFAMQGFRDEYKTGGNSGANVFRIFSLYYLQIPVNVQYRFNIAEETNLLFQAGPYAGFGLFGRQTHIRNGITQDLDSKLKKITFGTDNDVQKLMDYGIGAGVGIEFVRFQFMLGYDFGLAKIPFQKPIATNSSAGSGYNMEMRNHNFSATIAIIFGRRDPLYNVRD